jgi:DNA-dependent RNA polymerase auxiliary subunit epsilon
MKDKDIKLLKESVWRYDKRIEFAENFKGDYVDYPHFIALMERSFKEDVTSCALCMNYNECSGCPISIKYNCIGCDKTSFCKMQQSETIEEYIKYAKEMREQIRACLPQKIEKLKHVAQSEVRCKINEIIDHINTTTVDKSEISTKGDKEVPFRVGGRYYCPLNGDTYVLTKHNDIPNRYRWFIVENGKIYSALTEEEVREHLADKKWFDLEYLGQLSDYLKGLKSEKSL